MRVAIAGYGVEGQSSYKYFVAKGDDVTIVTNKVSPQYPLPDGAQAIVEDDAFDRLEDFDMVVRTPPMRPDSIHTNGKVWSATNEFFAMCPVPIIGVTGTKGKGTTCSLIESILRAAGHTVHLVGNIGTPALDVLPQIKEGDFVVYELSSFQLWDIEKSPHVAVVLMIEPDHLDVHKDFDEYLEAKSNIRRFQWMDDECLYHPTNQYSHQIAATPLVHAPVLETEEYGGSITFAQRYATSDDDQVYVRDGFFCVQDRQICSIDNLQLPGAHNLENACAAMSVITELWLDVTDEEYAKGLQSFTGLPHRLKFVRETEGVKYYDDSIATTPGSAIAALRAFNEPKVIILGGSDKGAAYQEIVDVCSQTGTRVVAIGQTGERIAELCRQHEVEAVRETGGMSDVVAAARREAKPGEVVILSPASASFDQYKSYSDRGDQYVAAVEEL